MTFFSSSFGRGSQWEEETWRTRSILRTYTVALALGATVKLFVIQGSAIYIHIYINYFNSFLLNFKIPSHY